MGEDQLATIGGGGGIVAAIIALSWVARDVLRSRNKNTGNLDGQFRTLQEDMTTRMSELRRGLEAQISAVDTRLNDHMTWIRQTLEFLRGR